MSSRTRKAAPCRCTLPAHHPRARLSPSRPLPGSSPAPIGPASASAAPRMRGLHRAGEGLDSKRKCQLQVPLTLPLACPMGGWKKGNQTEKWPKEPNNRIADTSQRRSPLMGPPVGAPLQYSCLENTTDGGAWWAAVHGVMKSPTRLSDFTFTFHFHASEKDMATHSSVLVWRIPGTGEPGGLPSMGSHRVRHD